MLRQNLKVGPERGVAGFDNLRNIQLMEREKWKAMAGSIKVDWNYLKGEFGLALSLYCL